MKIEVRVLSHEQAQDRLAADPGIGARYDHRSAFMVDAESPDLARMVQITRRTDGLSLGVFPSFTPREIAQAPYVQMQARKVMATSERDDALNIAHNEALPLRGRPRAGVRLMERFVSSSGKVPTRALAGAGEFGNEYVAGIEAAEVLRQAVIRGLALRPVLTAKGEERQDAFHLFTPELAPAALLEEGVVSRHGDPAGDPDVQLAGGLVYEPAALRRMPPDMARTLEPFAEWAHPLWLLSARVARLLAEAKVTGVGFTPVLVRGTPLHEEYVRRWRALVDLVSVNPRNSLR